MSRPLSGITVREHSEKDLFAVFAISPYSTKPDLQLVSHSQCRAFISHLLDCILGFKGPVWFCFPAEFNHRTIFHIDTHR